MARSSDVRVDFGPETLDCVRAILVVLSCFHGLVAWAGLFLKWDAILCPVCCIVGGNNGRMTVSFRKWLKDTFEFAHVMLLEGIDPVRHVELKLLTRLASGAAGMRSASTESSWIELRSEILNTLYRCLWLLLSVFEGALEVDDADNLEWYASTCEARDTIKEIKSPCRTGTVHLIFTVGSRFDLQLQSSLSDTV